MTFFKPKVHNTLVQVTIYLFIHLFIFRRGGGGWVGNAFLRGGDTQLHEGGGGDSICEIAEDTHLQCIHYLVLYTNDPGSTTHF